MHYWPATGRLYFVIAGVLYSADPSNLASITTLSSSLDTTSRFVGFAELHTGAARYLVLLDGVKGWYIDTSDAETQITDSDFPTPHIPTPVCFDGYIFVAKSGTQDIYNCLPATPATWQASTFIRSEQYSGLVTAIAGHRNMLVVFHTDGTAFYKNAGIPAPNSPLQRVVELNVEIGVDYYFNIRLHSDSLLYFLGTGRSSLGRMYKLESNKITVMEAPVFEQIISTYAEFASFSQNRKLLSMEWFSQTFLLWEPTDPDATGADALTMVLNADNGQLSFWMARDPDDATTPAFSTSTDTHLPLGLIEIIRVEDQFVGWNHKTVSTPLVVLSSGVTTAPVVGDADTLLLWDFETVDLKDVTETYQYTVGGAFTGTLPKFGIGAGSYTLGTGNPAYAELGFDWTAMLQGLDWTIEAWLKAPASANAQIVCFATPNDGILTLGFRASDDIVYWNITGTSGSIIGPEAVASGQTIATDTWYHCAIVHTQSDSKYSLFFNGVRIKQVTSAVQVGSSSGFKRIGFANLSGGTGFIDEQRVSRSARYSGATYTIPTAAFDAPAETDGFGDNGVGTIESYIDIIYRSPLITGDTPANKVLAEVVVDGMDYASLTDGTANPGNVIIRAFDNASARRVASEPSRTITYSDSVTRPHTTFYPLFHGKSFLIEWQYGVDNNNDPRLWTDFFGKIYYRLQGYGRQAPGK